MNSEWRKVTKAEPCPVCGKGDWCKLSNDGAVALCSRTEAGSFQAAKNGQGWLHRLKDEPRQSEYVGAAHRKANGTPKPAATGKVYPTADDAVAAAGATAGGTLAGEWTYHYSDGREALRVLRFNQDDGGKSFRPIHPAKGGWKLGDPSGLLPVYRLPALAEEPIIWIVEGEKAAEAAVTIGLPATTSAHGAGSAEKSDWTPLAGRKAIILPDADEPGAKYAQAVARLLMRLDPPARVKIVELPGLPVGGDIVEYIAAGGTRESITAIAAAAPTMDPADVIGGPVLTRMSDVEPREIAWLWQGRIPLGRISLLVGRPGEGKSFCTTDMAARVSTGTPWPDGSPCPIGSVLFVCAEDDPADTVRPRLDAHRADCRRIHLLPAVRSFDANGKPEERMFTLAELPALEAALKTVRDCKLIVVDPIGSFLGGDADSHRDNEVRSVLAPVARLAEKYGPAVLVVAHRRKASGTSADDLAMGSRAFTGIARAVWHLSRDKDDKRRRLLLPGKNNLAPEGDGLAFTIAGDPAAIVWEHAPVTMSADDALAVENGEGGNERRPGPEPAATNAAREWLGDLLADSEVAAATVKAEAQAAGLAWRTVQRAADALGVIREKNTFNGGWQWRFPKPGTEDANRRCQDPEEENNLASWHLGENPEENGDSTCQVPEDAKSDLLGTFEANEGTEGEREGGEL